MRLQVCNHPALVENGEGEDEAEAWEEGGARASGKLLLLAELIPRLHKRNRTILLLSKDSRVRDPEIASLTFKDLIRDQERSRDQVLDVGGGLWWWWVRRGGRGEFSLGARP